MCSDSVANCSILHTIEMRGEQQYQFYIQYELDIRHDSPPEFDNVDQVYQVAKYPLHTCCSQTQVLSKKIIVFLFHVRWLNTINYSYISTMFAFFFGCLSSNGTVPIY